MAAFTSVEDVRREAEKLAREAAAKGTTVCGYLGAGPVELIEAAGMRPLLLSAGDAIATPKADRYMEDLFDPVVRGVFERILRGDYSYLSAIVLPRAGDSVHRLYYYLCEVQRLGEAKLPPILLFDVVQTPGASSERYSAGRVAHLWDQLKALGDMGAGETALQAAVRRAEARRAMLERFIALRRADRSGISGGEALATFAAARSLPDEVFVAKLEAGFAAGAGASAAGPRIVIAGNPHDDDGLHRLIEQAGARVVGDYHGSGELSVGEPIRPGDPLAVLQQKYQAGVTGQRSFGDPAERLVAFVKAARADAVVFSFWPMEEALTWDYPSQLRALDKAGIVSLRLDDQARPFDSKMHASAVSELVTTLKARAKA